MLGDQIRADMTAAMKAQEPLRLSVLRGIASELNYKKIEVQRELVDTDVVSVLQKEAKKRREAIEAYQKAGRTDSAAKEQQELEIIDKYLPVQMTEAEVLAELGDLSRFASFSEAMREVSAKFRGRADGSLVAKLVKEKLPA